MSHQFCASIIGTRLWLLGNHGNPLHSGALLFDLQSISTQRAIYALLLNHNFGTILCFSFATNGEEPI